MKFALYILLIFLLVPWFADAQTQRGIKPVKPKSQKTQTTRALIIGISDYQDSLINDLKYAHRDAEAFARFLLSDAGGAIPKENVQLLVNEQATGGKVRKALSWLLDSTKAGDVAIVYFAGHGDVESKYYAQPGYFLLWDSPNRSYFLNALSMSDLQIILNTLTVVKQSKVIMISDACRSGTLAGSSIGGAKATAEAMLELFKNQLLILSCQPDEVSIEGEQWGGGRGIFSYYFVDGLQGMANINMDSTISVMEIQRYLQDKVTPDAQKLNYTQTPVIRGNVHEILALIPNLKDKPTASLDKDLPTLMSVRSPYYEEHYIRTADTPVLKLYNKFETALTNKDFIKDSTEKTSANELFAQLSLEKSLHPVINYIKHNYAAALQDDAQQVLNSLINPKAQELSRSKVFKLQKYKNYPLYLKRAAELLGKNHFIYRNLKARQYFFEGLLMLLENSGNKNETEGQKIMEKFRESLLFEQHGPHTYFYMMYTQATKFVNKDSASYFAKEAMRCSQSWALPYTYLSYFNSFKFKDSIEARKYLELATALDPDDLMVINTTAAYHFYKKDFGAAIQHYGRMIKRDSTIAIAWMNTGLSQLSLQQFDQAANSFEKAITLDSLQFLAYHYLGVLHFKKGNDSIAGSLYLKARSLNPKSVRNLRELARLYRKQQRNEESWKLYKEVITLDPKYMEVYYELSCLAALKSETKESLQYLELALIHGLKDFESLDNNEELNLIRSTKEYKQLIVKYRE